MNFHGYLFRQFSFNTLLVLASLLAVVWLNHALRMLELVVNKDGSFFDFILLSLFPMPLWLIIALPMAGFIGVIWTIYRFLTDRELIVMQAIGISPSQFSKMPLLFGLLLTVILSVNSLVILPYGYSKFKELQTLVRASIPKLLIQDNVFIDIADDMTLFVGERINRNKVGRVFIQDARNPDRLVTLTSETGHFLVSNNRPLFILSNGQRTELALDGSSTASLSFETHMLDIGQNSSTSSRRNILDSHEENILNLLFPPDTLPIKYANDRKAMGHYRIASPFLALCLVILATSIMLHGRILRETVNRRILIVALLGVSMQAGLILSRSLTASSPFLWPSLYLVILLPMIVGLYLIVKPTAFAIFWSRVRPQSPLKTLRGEQ
ncbi:MAG: LptF/LptG family permease [Candidatus Puniceispirillaceae bacterium]